MPYQAKPMTSRKFAVGAQVKTLDGVFEGVIKELLSGSDVLVTTRSGASLRLSERQLTVFNVKEMKDDAQMTAVKRDKDATIRFLLEEQQPAPPPGLWHDGRRVRASLPGKLTRTSTLHTKPVRIVVAALPGALRYVP